MRRRKHFYKRFKMHIISYKLTYPRTQDKVCIIRAQMVMFPPKGISRYEFNSCRLIFIIIFIIRIIIFMVIINILIIIISMVLHKFLTSVFPMQWNTRIKNPYNEYNVHESHLTELVCLINSNKLIITRIQRLTWNSPPF